MPKNKPTTMNELRGAEQDFSLKNLSNILGDKMLEYPENASGRVRLINSLQQRFGDSFRAVPGVRDIISQFDKRVKLKKFKDLMGRR